MSVVALKQGNKIPIALEALQETAQKANFKIAEQHQKDYLDLLNATDTIIQYVLELPEYRIPSLKPVETIQERQFWKVEDNVLNAWSHQSYLQAPGHITTNKRLFGRTVCFKDNISIGGLPLTCGTSPQFLSDNGEYPISTIDAPVVARVLQASGTVRGTATCENYSMCALSYSSASGPVHNPWLSGYTSGGSSSGCAALIASNRVKEWSVLRGIVRNNLGEGCDIGIGTDQGGSIRLPAAYSGVYGLKPTHGFIPYTGIASLHPLIDHCGIIANSIYDVADMLSVLGGYDGIDPRMTPETPLQGNVKDYHQMLDKFSGSKPKGAGWSSSDGSSVLRVGIIKEAWEVAGLDPQVSSVVRKAAQRFEKSGAIVKEVSIPRHSDGPAIWTAVTRATMANFSIKNQPLPLLSYPLPHLSPPSMTQEWYENLSHHNPAAVNVALSATYLSSQYSPSTIAKAMMHVHELRAAYDVILEEFDVLVTPVNPTVGMKHPKEEDGVMDKISLAVGNTLNTCPFNVSGHPALSIPVGWAKVADGEEKLPVGMQIISKRWNEEVVLKAALQWEAAGHGLYD